MRIFITGATGFIGTHLVKRVAQTGHEMVCLVRETSDVSTLEEVGRSPCHGRRDRQGIDVPFIEESMIGPVGRAFGSTAAKRSENLASPTPQSALLLKKRLHFIEQ